MEAENDNEKIWECPNLFKLGNSGKYVLIYSPDHIVKYYTGTLNSDLTFTPEYHGTIDHSGWEGFYAPNSLEDGQGRRILWGWLTEIARGDSKIVEGWAGAQSVPRVLTLQENGQLKMVPAQELEQLRGEHERLENLLLDGEIKLKSNGRALEIVAEFQITDAKASFGFKLLQSDEEETVVEFDPSLQRFVVDRTKSSLSDLTRRTELPGQIAWKQGDTVQVHIFLDHSLLEVFANYDECLSTSVFPTLEESEGVSLFARNGSVNVKSLTVYQVKSIW
jgi:beta-fructofuranosidase